jgi:hypothetical protein
MYEELGFTISDAIEAELLSVHYVNLAYRIEIKRLELN